jgi:acyl-[acyl-carrier-protein]-phospholipid O-acyltransferase/long-chain-fatty-acid--[acyl-carrier-protein] ligase
MVVLTALGIFTGIFAVPLQVFMQSRPPDALKGRMMATQNLLNWLAITGSAGLYWLQMCWIRRLDWPISTTFAMTSLLMIAIVVWYRPKAGYKAST